VSEEPFELAPAFPRLSAELIAALDEVGERRALAAGELLYRAGEPTPALFVVLSGRVAIVDDYGRSDERVLGVHDEGSFVGELTMLTGQPAYLTVVVREAGEAIVVDRRALRTAVSSNQRLGDAILSALIARRAVMVGHGSGMRLVGSSLSPETRRLREFLARNRIPHAFLDVESDPQAETMLRELEVAPGETPLVLRGSLTLRNPTIAQVAQALELRPPEAPAEVYDTIVVGGGPAGLGAAVYAASEGLSTGLVDSMAIGGQASTSSRIENYLGFPAGISGADLAERASLQARRFGARSAVPIEAFALSLEDGYHVVELAGGDRLRGRAVVIATGARYRRLDLPHLEEYEGLGVYYAATEIEAQMCENGPVAVVGGANSAGQAAIFLAGRTPHVDLLVRGSDLGASMSRYLVDQILASPNISVHLRTEVRELHGDGALERITVADAGSGATSDLDVTALFVLIGADPCTGWCSDALALDEHGFILTGADLRLAHLDPGGGEDGRSPLPLETSRAGVFAAGDVRSGSIKRVASAVGEGAMAVRLIHQYLALLDGAS
jgi:thioredoxin reductase (NADPH)